MFHLVDFSITEYENQTGCIQNGKTYNGGTGCGDDRGHGGSQTLNKSQSAPKVKKPNFGKTEIRKIGLINNEQPNQTKTTTADVNVVIGKIDGTQFAGAEKSAIAKALKKSGLGPAEADRLIEYLMAKYPGGGDNPPGLLLQALREGWKAPAGFKTAAEKEAERQAAGDNYERRRAAAERENLRRMGLV